MFINAFSQGRERVLTRYVVETLMEHYDNFKGKDFIVGSRILDTERFHYEERIKGLQVFSSVDEILVLEQNIKMPKDCLCLFEGCLANSIVIENVDFSDVGCMDNMFSNCNDLMRVCMEGKAPSVYSLNCIFSGCDKLKTVDMSRFYLSNLSRVSEVFKGCCNLRFVKMNGISVLNLDVTDLLKDSHSLEYASFDDLSYGKAVSLLSLEDVVTRSIDVFGNKMMLNK